MKTLYHDKPSSVGAANVLRRVRQMTELKWTPVRPLPSCLSTRNLDGTRTNFYGYFPEWRPQQGVPYSSCRTVEKYVGWNVSAETFLSALSNPNSVVYTRELKDQPGSKGNCFYGSVCSAQVSYALDLPYRVVCKEWPFLPGMHPVDTDRLENLKLCDVIVNPKAHIAMITDIARDEKGRVCEIEVSEETLPLSIRTGFSAEEFRRYWLEREYSVYRYDKVDEVGYTPDPFMPVEGDPELPVPPINRDLMPDYGNKANYRIGDEPVELSALTEGWKEFELTAPDGTVHRYPVGDGPLRLEPAQAGIWNARLLGEGKESAPVAWCMVDLKAETDKNVYKPGEEIRLHFENTAKEDRVFHYVLNTESFYVLRNGDFTGREIADGCASFPAPDEEGLYNLIVLAKNQYGIYTSRYVYFRVEQAG